MVKESAPANSATKAHATKIGKAPADTRRKAPARDKEKAHAKRKKEKKEDKKTERMLSELLKIPKFKVQEGKPFPSEDEEMSTGAADTDADADAEGLLEVEDAENSMLSTTDADASGHSDAVPTSTQTPSPANPTPAQLHNPNAADADTGPASGANYTENYAVRRSLLDETMRLRKLKAEYEAAAEKAKADLANAKIGLNQVIKNRREEDLRHRKQKEADDEWNSSHSDDSECGMVVRKRLPSKSGERSDAHATPQFSHSGTSSIQDGYSNIRSPPYGRTPGTMGSFGEHSQYGGGGTITNVKMPTTAQTVNDMTLSWLNEVRSYLAVMKHGGTAFDLSLLVSDSLWATIRRGTHIDGALLNTFSTLRLQSVEATPVLEALLTRYHYRGGLKTPPAVVSFDKLFGTTKESDTVLQDIELAFQSELRAGNEPDPLFTKRYVDAIKLKAQEANSFDWQELSDRVARLRSKDDLLDAMTALSSKIRDIREQHLHYTVDKVRGDKGAFITQNGRPLGSVLPRQNAPPGRVAYSGQCHACGRTGHQSVDCDFAKANHPGVNYRHKDVNWADSWQGKAYALLQKAVCPSNMKPDGTPYVTAAQRDGNSAKGGAGKKLSRYQPPGILTLSPNACQCNNTSAPPVYTSSAREEHCLHLPVFTQKGVKEARVLLDSGATRANYIRKDVSQKWGLTARSSNFVSCSVDQCKRSLGVVSLKVKIGGNTNTFAFEIYEPGHCASSPELIIGLQDIRRYSLFETYRDFFSPQPSASTPTKRVATPEETDEPLLWPLFGPDFSVRHSIEESIMPKLIAEFGMLMSIARGTAEDAQARFDDEQAKVGIILGALELAKYDPPDPWDDNPMAWELYTEAADSLPNLDKVSYEGSDRLRALLRNVVRKHKDVFTETLSGPPSLITPMKLNVDKSKWELSKNRGPVRQLSQPKLLVERQEVEKLRKAGILQPSLANHWSHPHIPQKPKQDASLPTQYRFCLDLRNANEATESLGWPLPRIQDIMRRISEKKPKYFCVLDLTSGYFQVELDKESRQYTAILTHYGLYENTRIPMGSKGAASYFQKQMSIQVLYEYLYNILEVYIDDIIIYAQSEDELAVNLDKVLSRLAEWNIKVHPAKAKLGLTQVEYVGHIISAEGLTMSRAKIEKIVNFVQPTTTNGIQKFLGMVGWFKDHIDNYSTVARPLRDMISHGDKKTTSRKWTKEATKAFNNLKTFVNACPTLYFPDTDDEVHLETDASVVGIGAVLYVIRDGKKWPVQWFSESFSKQQRNWKTQEQECYGIIAAVKHFHHYLSHIHFTLHTDHMSLLALNENTPKVVRWRVELSQYNFTLKHIPGKLNVVADALSRLDEIEKNGGWFLSMDEWDSPEVDGTAEGVVLTEIEEVTPREITRLLKKCHCQKAGHVGVDKTERRMQENAPKLNILLRKYSKADLHRWTTRFVRQCTPCQAMAILKPKIKTFPFLLSGSAPFVRINFDTIGPLDKDVYGHTHALVIVDTFSKYVKLRPLLDLSGLTAAVHLKEYINSFGVPAVMLSDNGTQFVNEVCDAYATMVGSEKLETLAYSHEENGIVERANREVLRHIRTMIYETKLKKHWSEMLPDVERILNSTHHTSLGTTPARIVFGNSVDLDRGVITPLDESLLPARPDYRDFVTRQGVFQSEVIQHAQRYLEAQEQKMLVKLDGKAITAYAVGSFVMLKVDNRKRNRAEDKLDPNWTGPYRVLSISNQGRKYEIEDLPSGKVLAVHVTELKKFYYDPATDPVLQALADAKHYIVESIVAHRRHLDNTGLPKGRAQARPKYEFLVHWQGYPEADRTWEPIDHLRNNAIWIQYCKDSSLTSLIPKRFKM